jgi:hypothetical protein
MSAEAHAGCLSFELSSRNHRIVVNCGLPATSRDTWRHVARATAAHSTVTFNDTSSCRFLTSESLKRLVGVPILAGPTDVPVSRQEREGGVILKLSHDGYADRFGVLHHRTLRLHATDGASTARICSWRRMARVCRPGAATPSRCASTCIPRQGEPPSRRPRRHAGAAEPGGLDLRRL